MAQGSIVLHRLSYCICPIDICPIDICPIALPLARPLPSRPLSLSPPLPLANALPPTPSRSLCGPPDTLAPMDPSLSLLLIGLGTLALLWIGLGAIAYVTAIQRLLRSTLSYPAFHLEAFSDQPSHVEPLLKQPVELLQQQGFESVAGLTIQFLATAEGQAPGVLMYHPRHHTYAQVTLRRLPEMWDWFEVSFYNFFRDGSLLLTLNGQIHGLVGTLPQTTVLDAYSPKLEIQWQTHLKQLERARQRRDTALLTPAGFLKVLSTHHRRHLDRLNRRGQVLTLAATPNPSPQSSPQSSPQRSAQRSAQEIETLPQSPESPPLLESPATRFHLTWGTAHRLIWQRILAHRKRQQLNQQRRQLAKRDPAYSIELPLAAEVEAFQRMNRMEGGSDSLLPSPSGHYAGAGRGSSWILPVTLVLFILSSLQLFDWDLPVLGMFVAAIVLHEAGHFWAMRWLGYRDTSVFFLPFFGGAAIGRKDHASLSDKIGVLLAGPLPGLILGMALCLWGLGWEGPDLAMQAGLIFAGLNWFNLLPIYPLDGGKIAHLLVFSYSPWADVIFRIVAVVALGSLGLQSPVALLLALAIALSIPMGLRSARLRMALRPLILRQKPSTPVALGSPEAKASLSELFQLLRHRHDHRLPFAQRYQLVKDLWQSRQDLAARWPLRLGWLGLYGIALLSPLFSGMALLGDHAPFPWPFSLFQGDSPNSPTVVAPRPAPIARRDAPNGRPSSALPSPAPSPNASPATPDNLGVDAQGRPLPPATFNPQHPAALLKPSYNQARRDSISQQLDSLSQQIAKAPTKQALRQQRAQLYQAMGNYEAARQDYTQLIDQQPGNLNAYLSRADVWRALQNYDAALLDLNQVLAQAPQSQLAYFARGDLYLAQGRYSEALADADRLIQINPQNPEAFYLRADIYRQMGAEEKAVADQQRGDNLLTAPEPPHLDPNSLDANF